MFGTIVCLLLIIGLIAFSTKLVIGMVQDIKATRQARKNAKSTKKELSDDGNCNCDGNHIDTHSGD